MVIEVEVGASPLLSAQEGSGATRAEATTRPPVLKRRASIACGRCRRMRCRCVHDKATPPCDNCKASGYAAKDCVFTVRGQVTNDREYRHPRQRADRPPSKKIPVTLKSEAQDTPEYQTPDVTPDISPTPPIEDWEYMPPLTEVIEGVERFVYHYFQLGFIPKRAFVEQLKTAHRSVSTFFLFSLLSISARLTPSLIKRYGSGQQATEYFMAHASAAALPRWLEVNLAHCQAFLLLSIAQQGSAMRQESFLNLGHAIQFAILLGLHREETYRENPRREDTVALESARRTLWVLHSQDNLHAGPMSLVSLAAKDITTLLPCGEDDFANGVEPNLRAALPDTPPAIADIKLTTHPDRSLFASLVQVHYLWGDLWRRVPDLGKSECPWLPVSEYGHAAARLRDWEANLPRDHHYSETAHRKYKARREDLAWLSVTMVTRLCNIVLRRAFLDDIRASMSGKSEPGLRPFWTHMSCELFANVAAMYNQIENQWKIRRRADNMGVQMATFCAYSCGILGLWLCKEPQICPDVSITQLGPAIVHRCFAVLEENKRYWSVAEQWSDSMARFRDLDLSSFSAANGIEGSMADSREPIPNLPRPAGNHVSPKPRPPPVLRAPSPVELDQLQVADASDPVLPAALNHAIPVEHMYIEPNVRLGTAQAPSPPLQSPLPPLNQLQIHMNMHSLRSPTTMVDAQGSNDTVMLMQPSYNHPQHQLPNLHPGLAHAAHVHPGAALYNPQVGPAYLPPVPMTDFASNDGYDQELSSYVNSTMTPVNFGWMGAGTTYGYPATN